MLALLREEPCVPAWSQKGCLSQQGFVYLLTKWIKYMPSYVPPGPRRFVTKGCLQGTWQGAFPQQREAFGRPRKGEVLCCFLLPHLHPRGGKSNIATECWANPFSPLSSLWKQLLYGKDGALTVITPADLSFVLVAEKEPVCPRAGINSLGMFWIRDENVSSSQRQVPRLEALFFHQLVPPLGWGALVLM